MSEEAIRARAEARRQRLLNSGANRLNMLMSGGLSSTATGDVPVTTYENSEEIASSSAVPKSATDTSLMTGCKQQNNVETETKTEVKEISFSKTIAMNRQSRVMKTWVSVFTGIFLALASAVLSLGFGQGINGNADGVWIYSMLSGVLGKGLWFHIAVQLVVMCVSYPDWVLSIVYSCFTFIACKIHIIKTDTTCTHTDMHAHTTSNAGFMKLLEGCSAMFTFIAAVAAAVADFALCVCVYVSVRGLVKLLCGLQDSTIYI
eukprot:GHVR01126381.1.p1 GENE.GHVR01126381.1~~GHVR01126381.1.p1  ORF type:complete len:261 (+),score=46.19 GHVR01126381.1:38-820(+)